MKLSEMRQLLADRDLRLTKSMGQNFLHDGNQLRRIVRAAELAAGESVLEIGPGLGPLTELLIAEAGTVLAIEKDRRLVEILRERFAASPRLQLLCDDALDYVQREQRDWSQWKLVANLPYSVASPILVELATAPESPIRMVATLQLEVVRRLAANASDPDYGLLTLLIGLRYRVRDWFKIPAACFFPAPDVDSACVTLDRRAQPLLDAAQEPVFRAIVRTSFSQRRKMMFRLLKATWPEERLEAAFRHAGLSLQVRAEAVGLDPFVELTRFLNS